VCGTLAEIVLETKMENSKLSNLKLILSGLLIVNIPITIIILSSIYLLMTYFSLRFTESTIIGAAIGWGYWEFASRFWIKWSLQQGVEKKRLHKIGMLSLVLWKWDSEKIEKISSKLNQGK
jgi:hypothetical protein